MTYVRRIIGPLEEAEAQELKERAALIDKRERRAERKEKEAVWPREPRSIEGTATEAGGKAALLLVRDSKNEIELDRLEILVLGSSLVRWEITDNEQQVLQAGYAAPKTPISIPLNWRYTGRLSVWATGIGGALSVRGTLNWRIKKEVYNDE